MGEKKYVPACHACTLFEENAGLDAEVEYGNQSEIGKGGLNCSQREQNWGRDK